MLMDVTFVDKVMFLMKLIQNACHVYQIVKLVKLVILLNVSHATQECILLKSITKINALNASKTVQIVV